MSGKYLNRIKENGFYILLLFGIVIITLVLTFLSVNREPKIAEEPNIDLNEELIVEIPDPPKQVEERLLDGDQNIDMEVVTNLPEETELGDNFLIVKEDEEDDQAPPKEDTVIENQNVDEDKKPVEEKAEETLQQTFIAYDNNHNMLWPTDGEIVMDFSMDMSIYDPTLDLYRTNDVLCIQSEIGTNVVSSADGVIESISETEDYGMVVVIDHGNGWKTTYGQIAVEENLSKGQMVQQGEVIGQVTEPTIYSYSLGPHVGYKVTKDDGPCNPTDHLVKN